MDVLQDWQLPRHPLSPRILTCDRVALDERWSFSLRSPFWRLYRNDEDGSAITWPGGTHRLMAGRWSILPPWIDYQSTCSRPTPHRFLHVQIPELGPVWCREHAPGPVRLGPDPQLDALADELDRRRPGPGNHLLARCIVDLALTRFTDGLGPAASAALADLLRERGPLAPARRMLEERLQRPPSVGQLAAACGYSEEHFARLVRVAEGCPPRCWIERQRISLAAERLAHGNDPIDQLADDLGYADRFHFSKAFRRVMGAPPARWRSEQQAPGR